MVEELVHKSKLAGEEDTMSEKDRKLVENITEIDMLKPKPRKEFVSPFRRPSIIGSNPFNKQQLNQDSARELKSVMASRPGAALTDPHNKTFTNFPVATC